MDESKSDAFVRETTGLVKQVSFLDTLAINISYMSVGAALALIGFTMILLPTVNGVNLVYGSIIAALIAIPQVVVYTIMQRRVSRTGGDYVWLSRSLGGFLGSSLSFMGMTMETMPYLALIALSVVFAIGSVGVAIGNTSFNSLSTSGVNPILQFLFASVILVALVLLNIVRPKAGFRIISVFWIVGLSALIISIATLLLAGKTGVVSYIDHLGIANVTYDSVTASYQGSDFNLGNTLLILPFFALFSYPWFNATPSVGSEIKGKRAIAWNAPISLVLTFILVTAPLATMYYVGGFAFTNGALTNASLVYDHSFNFWTLAMGVSGNLVIELIIGLGWILFTTAVLAFGIITISRYLLAQSFDRFLPERLSYVSPKYASPVVAHLVDLVVTVVLIGLASFLYGTISSLYGAIVAAMIYFVFVGLAAVVYAVRHEKQSKKLILAIAGVLQMMVFGYLTYEFFDYHDVWGGNSLAYGYIICTFVAGVIIYTISRKMHKKKGVDISLAFKEIPPD
ncbi:MAG: APC family permease [Nitrososphaerota archaeon]|jgi:amino acid transporter|nr:APC family permease [Nitrososphaerota archaeon]MDG6922579.1 APC family permease [Nitrososphaerota archaeon]